MIYVESVRYWGFEHAIRGMRNPMNSWSISDSVPLPYDEFVIGDNDEKLMKHLCAAGPEHRKFLRQIFVSMDIVAPLYWWKEFDTYKIGTTADSCSTMHKIHAKEFVLDDFSHEHLYAEEMEVLETVIVALNGMRQLYLDGRHKNDWWQMIQLLPSSYNQRRTVTTNYEVAIRICQQREGHKLDEWHNFIYVMKNELPLLTELIDAANAKGATND